MSNTPKEVNLTLPAGTTEFTLREGKALDQRPPDKALTISGTLQAPWQFLTNKKDVFVAKSAHVRIYKDKGILELVINETDPLSCHTITGTLKKDASLDAFQINTTKRYTVSEFLRFIKVNRYFFADPADNSALVNSLQKWNAEITTIIAQHNTNDGNSLMLLEKKVGKVELVTEFNLFIPIYQGYPKQKFKVEIGLDPKANAIDLFLISDDLFELENTLREKYLAEELKNLDWFACSKIVMS